jgi:hypothetical protein
MGYDAPPKLAMLGWYRVGFVPKKPFPNQMCQILFSFLARTTRVSRPIILPAVSSLNLRGFAPQRAEQQQTGHRQFV